MDHLTLCMVFLVLSCQIQGSRAVTPVFVQKGNYVLLDIKDVPEKFITLVWRFNENNLLVAFSPGNEPIVNEVYTKRVEVSKDNYSVKLKSLTETDSGVYTARGNNGQEEPLVAEYNVTVQARNGAILRDTVMGGVVVAGICLFFLFAFA